MRFLVSLTFKEVDMEDLPSDIRELVLFKLQDVMHRLNEIEEMLCDGEDLVHPSFDPVFKNET